jgi:hypothetical protein
MLKFKVFHKAYISFPFLDTPARNQRFLCVAYLVPPLVLPVEVILECPEVRAGGMGEVGSGGAAPAEVDGADREPSPLLLHTC